MKTAEVAVRRLESRLLAKLEADAEKLFARLDEDEFRRVWFTVGGPDAPAPEDFILPPKSEQPPMTVAAFLKLIKTMEQVIADRPPEPELTREEQDEAILQAAYDICLARGLLSDAPRSPQDARRTPAEPRHARTGSLMHDAA